MLIIKNQLRKLKKKLKNKEKKLKQKLILPSNDESHNIEYLNYKYFQKLQKKNFSNFLKLLVKLQRSKFLDKIDLENILKDNSSDDD